MQAFKVGVDLYLKLPRDLHLKLTRPKGQYFGDSLLISFEEISKLSLKIALLESKPLLTQLNRIHWRSIILLP